MCAESDAVVIEVEDNGIGMDEATRQRLFEPFFHDKRRRPRYGFGVVDHLRHRSQSRWGDRRGE